MFGTSGSALGHGAAGALIGCLKIARRSGGDLRIARVGPRVQMVLELTSMHRVLPAYEHPEQAFGDG